MTRRSDLNAMVADRLQAEHPVKPRWNSELDWLFGWPHVYVIAECLENNQ